MDSSLSAKPVFKWKQWLIGNGIFAALIVFGISYQSMFCYLLAFSFMLLHIVIYLTVFLALRDSLPTADKVIRVFAQANTHPHAWLDILYDGLLMGYLFAVEAYAFAALYFVSMLLQRIMMHKSELYVMERPFGK